MKTTPARTDPTRKHVHSVRVRGTDRLADCEGRCAVNSRISHRPRAPDARVKSRVTEWPLIPATGLAQQPWVEVRQGSDDRSSARAWPQPRPPHGTARPTPRSCDRARSHTSSAPGSAPRSCPKRTSPRGTLPAHSQPSNLSLENPSLDRRRRPAPLLERRTKSPTDHASRHQIRREGLKPSARRSSRGCATSRVEAVR